MGRGLDRRCSGVVATRVWVYVWVGVGCLVVALAAQFLGSVASADAVVSCLKRLMREAEGSWAETEPGVVQALHDQRDSVAVQFEVRHNATLACRSVLFACVVQTADLCLWMATWLCLVW